MSNVSAGTCAHAFAIHVRRAAPAAHRRAGRLIKLWFRVRSNFIWFSWNVGFAFCVRVVAGVTEICRTCDAPSASSYRESFDSQISLGPTGATPRGGLRCTRPPKSWTWVHPWLGWVGSKITTFCGLAWVGLSFDKIVQTSGENS